METHLSNTGAIEFITFQHFRSLIVTGGSPWTLYQYDNYQVFISSDDHHQVVGGFSANKFQSYTHGHLKISHPHCL